MKFFSIIIWMFLFCNQINCFFKPDDFCKKNSTKIKNCMALNCGTKLCAYDKKKCDYFISWEIIIKKLRKKSNFYTNFTKGIKNCEQNDYKNQWSHRLNFG
jgi:hypothetical protein